MTPEMEREEVMWTALVEYQPRADKDGHGESWRVMCRYRTISACGSAEKDAYARLTTDSWAGRAAATAKWVMINKETEFNAKAEKDRYIQKTIERIKLAASTETVTLQQRMWEVVDEHQSEANENGYGKEWQKLCTERTPNAIREAFDAVPKGVMEKLLDKVHASTTDKVD
jgi:hypothetical protein